MTSPSLLITADRLVDGRGGPPVPDAGALVDAGGAISWAGPLTQVPDLPADCRRVSVPDSTLLPGFIDTHVHFAVGGGGLNVAAMLLQPVSTRVLQIAERFRVTLEAGVTTVRDLGCLGPDLEAMVTSGAVPGPRILNAISMVSTTGGHGDFPLPAGVDVTERLRALDLRLAVADGPDQVQATVRDLIRSGAHVIKVAATGGVSTPADGPDDVGLSLPELRAAVRTAADRGRTVAAHAIGTAGIANAIEAGVHSVEHGNGVTVELARRMAELGIFLVPTLTVLAEAADPTVIGEEAHRKAARWQHETRVNLPVAIEAGVRVAMGTDAGLGSRHGHNLRELVHLVEFGMSPMDAIVAGTRTAAQVCGLADQIGTIEPGKRADLVVARGNPLEDIKVVAEPANIAVVVQNGRVVKNTDEKTRGE